MQSRTRDNRLSNYSDGYGFNYITLLIYPSEADREASQLTISVLRSYLRHSLREAK